MKKSLILIGVFVALFISGCGDKKNLTKEECKLEQEKIFADMWNKKIDEETANKLLKENHKICCKYSAFKKGCQNEKNL